MVTVTTVSFNNCYPNIDWLRYLLVTVTIMSYNSVMCSRGRYRHSNQAVPYSHLTVSNCPTTVTLTFSCPCARSWSRRLALWRPEVSISDLIIDFCRSIMLYSRQESSVPWHGASKSFACWKKIYIICENRSKYKPKWRFSWPKMEEGTARHERRRREWMEKE